MKRRIDHEPGFVLHAHPYRETSLIVEVFTRRHGRLGLLARGARRPRSALRGVLLAFHPLRLSWSGAAELRNLVGAEWAGGHGSLAGVGLMCGFYLNELLLRLLPREDAHESLYDAYGGALAGLAAAARHAAVLRGFERRLLAELGYAPVLDREAESGAAIDPVKRYAYESERGPVETRRESGEAVVSGRTLIDMASDNYEDPRTREEARRLMRALIGERLGAQALHTRAVLAELQDL
ncbi:MAG TPA: DNA repair protein RecO [Burkholderiales bacterium]|nr:DNA repair protein RecO [Burkholderiales bacterium]